MRARMGLMSVRTFLLSSNGFCQIQRLGIPNGDVSIVPGGATTLNTYCTEYGVMAPKQGQDYRQTLEPFHADQAQPPLRRGRPCSPFQERQP
jgi:hypothetical protein